MAKEAIQGWIEAALKHGEEIPTETAAPELARVELPAGPA